MEKVNWKRFFISLAIFILVDVVLLLLKDNGILGKWTHFILHMVNMTIFIFSGVVKRRSQKRD